MITKHAGIVLMQRSKQLMAKKEDGNKAYRQGNYKEALDLYTEALTIDKRNICTNSKLYCNRALMAQKVSVELLERKKGEDASLSTHSWEIWIRQLQTVHRRLNWTHPIPEPTREELTCKREAG